MAQKAYGFNKSARHGWSFALKHMKELNRTGQNPASGNFPAGSNVRIRNKRPG